MNKSKKDDIANSKQYIDEHYNDTELTVSALAEKIDISEVCFRKLFKSQYGISPGKFKKRL